MESYRIGNIIKQGVIDLHESRLLKFDHFLQQDITIRCKGSFVLNPEPEILTSNWLYKLGLYRADNNSSLGYPFWKFRDIELIFESGNKYYFSLNCFNREIRYVHEVQNLYSTITGQEIDTRKFL